VRFDDIELDTNTRQLRKGDGDLHISTKAFDLLALLVQRRPNVVDKAEIRRHLWEDTFVSNANLPTLVAEIRSALGDDAKHSRFVRTVHGIGYSFDANAVAVDSLVKPADALPAGWLVGAAMRIAVSAGQHVLGREGDDVIAIQSPTVSRRHVRLTIEGDGRAVIEDLASKNGTFVNDRALAAATPLVDGDVVRIGSLVFTFRVARPGTSTQTI
jgi:DNA-binding winged helix-turn-helix (wHTH) protein